MVGHKAPSQISAQCRQVAVRLSHMSYMPSAKAKVE